MLLRYLRRCIPILLTVTMASAQITVSVRDTSARPVDTLLVPVSISGLVAGDSVYSVQATVTPGSPAVKIIGVETAGTLGAGATALYNAAQSKLAVAWTTPVTTNGVLVLLRVAVNGNPGSTYTIPLAGLQLNEGSPAAVADNGSLYVRSLLIQPHDPFGVVVGDTIQFSGSGNPVLPLVWNSSAPSVGTVDVNGRFIAIAQGSVRIGVVDAEGKRDSTGLFAVNPTSLRSLTISVPDTNRTQTLEIGIPVRVSDVTGLGIVSAQLRLTYSTLSLEYLGTESAGTLTDAWSSPVVNTTTPGILDYALAGTTELSGSGPILIVRFRVKPSYLSSTQISLLNVEFNEGILATTDNGTFTPLAAPSIVAHADRYSALKGETVTLLSTTGGTGPYVYASSDPSAASVDPSSGLVTVLTRGPVRVLVTDAQGFPGSSDTIRTYDFDAAFSDHELLASDSVEVPLTVGATSGLNILSFQFRFTYDTSVVRLRTVLTSGSLADGFAVDVRDTAGVVTVAGAGADPLIGSGELLRVRFVPNPAAQHLDTTLLAFTSFRFNEPGPSTAAARGINGTLTVIYPNAVPAFAMSQADTSIAEGTIFDVTYAATDGDGDTLTYSIASAPPGASIVDSTGQFVFAASYSDAGMYPVVLLVTDGRDSDTLSFVLTVLNVNRPPVFSHVLPDTTIDEGQALSFAYAASDPDADPLRFFVVLAPAGLTVDSLTGVLHWKPSYTQSGLHAVTIRVTDADLADTATAQVTVLNINGPPSFTSVLLSDSVFPGQAVSVTYQAIDPDGDPIRYHIVTAPAPAELDSLTGAFSWTPVAADTGSHVVRVVAVAGVHADTTQATIVVKTGTPPTGVSMRDIIPDGFSLGQNYPNPFNPSTTISIGLPAASVVRLELYNILGQMISVLYDGTMSAGFHQVRWEASVPTGIYMYRVHATRLDGLDKPYTSVKRMILSR